MPRLTPAPQQYWPDPFSLSFEAFVWICRNVPTTGVILEFGSGIGSFRLVKAGYEVISVESDPQWNEKFEGVGYIQAEIEDGWYDHTTVMMALTCKPWLTIIDGPRGSPSRKGAKKLAIEIFGGTSNAIMIDDVNRSLEMEVSDEFRRITGRDPIEIRSADGRTTHVYRSRLWPVRS